MAVHLQLSQQNLADIMQNAINVMSMSDLCTKLAVDGIIVQNIMVTRPEGAGVPITVVRDVVERYMELLRNPAPINGQWQPQEYAIVQY